MGAATSSFVTFGLGSGPAALDALGKVVEGGLEVGQGTQDLLDVRHRQSCELRAGQAPPCRVEAH